MSEARQFCETYERIAGLSQWPTDAPINLHVLLRTICEVWDIPQQREITRWDLLRALMLLAQNRDGSMETDPVSWNLEGVNPQSLVRTSHIPPVLPWAGTAAQQETSETERLELSALEGLLAQGEGPANPRPELSPATAQARPVTKRNRGTVSLLEKARRELLDIKELEGNFKDFARDARVAPATVEKAASGGKLDRRSRSKITLQLNRLAHKAFKEKH